MTHGTRRIAALAVLIAMFASLAGAGMAVAATGTITQQDCAQGTIKDQSTGQPIPRARCEALIGKNVQLASTGFDLRPVIVGGVLCLLVAGAFGMRRRTAHRLV
jgi:hypothetical protein